jgi:non-homologous end joining protein Ku
MDILLTLVCEELYMSNFEYRVRWQREGKLKRIKIYQTIEGANRYVDTLNGDYEMTEYEQDYFDKVPKLIEEPLIEKRSIGIWSPIS